VAPVTLWCRSDRIATVVDHERSGTAMLRRTDPFRELDRLATAMPMDAYRVGDEFVVAFDGVAPDAIELDVERNVLTVKAERRPVSTGQPVEMPVAERPLGCSPGNCSSATPSTPRTSTPPTTPES
jgi:HSP20 family molecular chaperone IbpA